MTKEDVVLWKFGFDVFQTLITVGIATYVWFVTKHKVNANKIEELEAKHYKQIHELKLELKEVRTTIKHMPDREQISRVHQRIDELSQGVSGIQGEMKGLSDTSSMILQTLIKNGESK